LITEAAQALVQHGFDTHKLRRIVSAPDGQIRAPGRNHVGLGVASALSASFNTALHLTASSLSSYVAPASGSR